MVKLVYKLDKKFTAGVRKGKSTAKVPLIFFLSHTYISIYINGHQPQSHNPMLAHAR